MFNEPLFFISDQCAVHNSYLSHQYMFNFSLLWEIINVENISTRELMAYSLTDIMSCHLLTVVLLNQSTLLNTIQIIKNKIILQIILLSCIFFRYKLKPFGFAIHGCIDGYV